MAAATFGCQQRRRAVNRFSVERRPPACLLPSWQGFCEPVRNHTSPRVNSGRRHIKSSCPFNLASLSSPHSLPSQAFNRCRVHLKGALRLQRLNSHAASLRPPNASPASHGPLLGQPVPKRGCRAVGCPLAPSSTSSAAVATTPQITTSCSPGCAPRQPAAAELAMGRH